ncbi:YidB family protein [Streptomyces albireticuli]|uniref:YidB family protein n=1 Tax=Streptomyces albireticuli TaxID=1940 RepID=UPI0027E2E6A3|nr:YidB family protein [Streptomyces albireticuli]
MPGPLPGKAGDMAGNDLGSLLGGLLGGGSAGGGGGGANLLAALLGTLGSDGGGNPLAGLLNQLRDGGLGEKADTWVGTGKNEDVSGPEVAQALPTQTLDHVAQQAGVSPEQAADEIARVLPEAVDKLTPQGQVPQGSLEDLLGRG